jgi:hypothetical protein
MISLQKGQKIGGSKKIESVDYMDVRSRICSKDFGEVLHRSSYIEITRRTAFYFGSD